MQCVTNNSIKQQSFIYSKLKDQTVLFQTIQFYTSPLFAHKTTMDCEMPNSPDTLRALLAGFSFMACLIGEILTTRAKFLKQSGK